MNPRKLVKVSNIVGIVSILLLVYWIFTFILMQVFGLKVFAKDLTDIFYFSILGILALMAGALMANIMFNLTLIADRPFETTNDDSAPQSKFKLKFIWLGLPIIAAVLFIGNYLSSLQRERDLVASAKYVLDEHEGQIKYLANYDTSLTWHKKSAEILKVLSKTDKEFPYIYVINRDTLSGLQLYFKYGQYYGTLSEKVNYVLEATIEEKEYLNSFFDDGYTEPYFKAEDGHYELFYPYTDGNKKCVLYFSDHKRYGTRGDSF